MADISLTFDRGTLVLRGATTPPRELFPQTAWTWDYRINAWRCDAIEYPKIIPLLEGGDLGVVDTVPQWESVAWPQPALRKLREEQAAAVRLWSFARQGLVVMPTGTGKTEVALHILAETACSTLVVVPVRDLMYQWHRRILEALGYDAGLIGDQVFRVRPVSITTYDSACIHAERLGDRFRLLVFDECHHLPGELRRDAARMSAAPWRLGLTATPERSDGRHADLEWLVGPLVYSMPLAEVRGKSLADYDVVRIPVHLSEAEQAQYDSCSRTVRSFIAEQRKTQPSYSWKDLCAATGKTPDARRAMRAYHAKKAIEDRAEEKLRVLEDLFRLHAAEPCIVFAGSNSMARDVSRRFLVPCLLNHCRKRERLEILQGFAKGVYPAIVANQVLDEGVDLPEAKVAIVLGGTSSGRQAKQRLGRVLRKSGNARAVLYEVVCADTKEEMRSRRRRATDAYASVQHRRALPRKGPTPSNQ